MNIPYALNAKRYLKIIRKRGIMSKFKCEKCNYTKCFLDTELNPHYCPILGKEIDGWQNIDKAYITLPRPSAPVTDWKKAFAMMCSSFGDSVVRTCHVCQVLGAKCSGDRSCGSIIIEAIKRKCTKGGE